MKIYVKQMYDWNYYAYFAEEVEEKYWDYFKSGLWWQIGNSFTKSFDNVQDFEYCAEDFAKYGETSIKQQLKILPAPWEKALDLFACRNGKSGSGLVCARQHGYGALGDHSSAKRCECYHTKLL